MIRYSAWFVAIAALGSGCAIAQTAAASDAPLKPLTALPYTPSLDTGSLDRTTDPCVDFYKYSCGGWMKNNPIPADQARWAVYNKLDNENSQFLWGILEEDAKLEKRNAIQQKVGDYYAACMDTAAIDRLGLKPLQPELARIDAIEDRKALAAFLREGADRRGLYFFSTGSEQDAKDAASVIAGLRAGGLGLPDRDYYTKTDARSEEIRKRYVAYLAQLLTLSGVPRAEAEAQAAATMKIETVLAQASLTRVEQRDPYKSYNPMKLQAAEAVVPALELGAYLRGENLPAASLAKVNVSQPRFFAALEEELAREPLPKLKAYLRVHALNRAAPNLSSQFDTAHFEFYGKFLRGIPEMEPRWKRCVGEVDRNLGEALGQEFVARTFSADTKAKVVTMTDQIEAAMQEEIEHLDWMSQATKKEALVKLHAVRNKIGYPDRWRDYSAMNVARDDHFGNAVRAHVFDEKREWAKVGKPVDRGEWGMSPPTVNAYYDAQMNDINFPAGVLQPPLYDPKEDDAPNYGNTGGTIGHELTHGFDDEGRQFDAQGNLKNWWTPKDAKGFEDRINCQRDQYAKYTVVDDIHINSKLTSGEDVADLGGTLLAYMAWKKQTAGQTLTPKEGFSPDQRFFIGFAQWACENDRDEDLRVSAVTDPHSPGKARINGIVTNMPQFASAFSCKAGQPMVKAPICKVW